MARNILKGSIDRFLEKTGEQIVLAIKDLQPKEIRSSFATIRSQYPIAADEDRYYSIGSRLQAAPLWGTLTTLSDGNATLALALNGGI